MKTFVEAALAALLVAAPALAEAGQQPWRPGWDYFGESLDFKRSSVSWTKLGSGQLALRFVLKGATPSRQYQVGLHLFDHCVAGFGTFPLIGGCSVQTREGSTRLLGAIELGVVTTDGHGNGEFAVVVSGIAPGHYEAAFDVRGGAGCNLGGYGSCGVIFESPGPYGATIPLDF